MPGRPIPVAARGSPEFVHEESHLIRAENYLAMGLVCRRKAPGKVGLLPRLTALHGFALVTAGAGPSTVASSEGNSWAPRRPARQDPAVKVRLADRDSIDNRHDHGVYECLLSREIVSENHAEMCQSKKNRKCSQNGRIHANSLPGGCTRGAPIDDAPRKAESPSGMLR
jgi:hypothetical protein